MSAQLEQRLGAAQLELRKLGSERHALRARLRREAGRVLELESALRAEKELRRQAAEEHQAALAELRARGVEVELRSSAEIARLGSEVVRLASELDGARVQLAKVATASGDAQSKAAKAPRGLRRIRGIGPGYERLLEECGVNRVEQVAAWSEADVAAYAAKLRVRVERISKEDWVGQARRLEPE